MHVLLAKKRVDDSASPPESSARPNDLLRRRQAHLKKLSLRTNITKRDRARLKAIVDPSKRLASNLEVALISCCEYPESEQSSASREVKCKHRPQFPSNYMGAAESLPKTKREKRDTKDKSLGVLMTGKEGHFLKLMLMFCLKSDVGHRALALAILQRTAQAEAKSKVVPARMLSFLSAGGLVLLSRWLVEAYTMVPQTQSTMQGAGGKKKNSTTTQSIASPTGKLLLPLLQLLATIPFDKELIVASQINKTIKRLKKILDKLIQTADPSSLGTFVHPIAGGLPVVKVRAAIDNVMEVWNQEALLDRKRKLALDPFDGMRRKLQSRYEDLCAFQSGAGDPPEWMPQSTMTVWVGASAGLATSLAKLSPGSSPTPTKISDQLYNERVQQQNAKATKSAAGGKLNSLRAFERSNSKTFGRSNSREMKTGPVKLPPKTFKISWADRPKDSVKPPRPLHEEFLFVPDQEQSDLPSDNITSAPDAGTLDFAASLQSALNMANGMSNDQATAVGAQDRLAGARQEQAPVYPATAPSTSEVPPTQSTKTEDDDDDSDMDDLF